MPAQIEIYPAAPTEAVGLYIVKRRPSTVSSNEQVRKCSICLMALSSLKGKRSRECSSDSRLGNGLFNGGSFTLAFPLFAALAGFFTFFGGGVFDRSLLGIRAGHWRADRFSPRH